jgi:hypothetical protein
MPVNHTVLNPIKGVIHRPPFCNVTLTHLCSLDTETQLKIACNQCPALSSFWDVSFWTPLNTEIPRTILLALNLPLLDLCTLITPGKNAVHHVQNTQQRVAKEVVELFGKAAEMFIMELSLVAWMNVLSTKKIVQITDVSTAVNTFHVYDFLLDMVPPPGKTKKREVREISLSS